MTKALIGGVTIHHLQAGQGPDLVLLQGLSADLSFWYLRIVPHLKDRWRVTVYDARGHGLSGMPASGYRTADFAEELIGLLDHLGIVRAHMAAHSFGGAVALQAAVLHPDRVQSLALFDVRVPALQPLPPTHDDDGWRARREALRVRGFDVRPETPKVLYSLLEDAADEDARGANGGSGFRPWNPDGRQARRWEKLRSETTLGEDLKDTCAMNDAALSQIAQPVLLSYGAKSRSLPTCRALEKCLPDHRTVVHPDLGHFFPAVRPEVAVRDLRTFLEEIERKDATQSASKE
jgi:pimeloyl-ACP methyl ester carboxylesterase